MNEAGDPTTATEKYAIMQGTLWRVPSILPGVRYGWHCWLCQSTLSAEARPLLLGAVARHLLTRHPGIYPPYRVARELDQALKELNAP